MLRIDLITDEAALAALVPEWQALDESLSPRTPFSAPDYCLTWWRHFSRGSLSIRDRMQVYALRDSDGALVAVAPMMLTQRPSVGPIRTRELQFFGADSYMTELRGPICQAERAKEVAQALERHLATVDRRWDWIQWRGLRETGDVSDWLRDKVHRGELTELIDHYIVLPASWDALRSGLPRNIKESLRKCYNSLARDGHAFEVRVVEAPADSDAAVRRFFELHNTRAEKTGTIDHIDVFASDTAQQFLLDYAHQMATKGSLRLFQLVMGDAVVATRIGFLLGDELYLYYSGYDVAWARYSVMTTLVAEALKWAIDQDLRIVNLSTGTDVSKSRWRPDQITYAGGFQVSRTPWARLAFNSIQYMRDKRSAAG